MLLESILRLGRKIIPKKIFRTAQPIYHWLLALTGALIYRFPSKKLRVIGVTGTKGKSSTVEILATILETAGHKVASSSTISFKVGSQTKANRYKMTMPGRFFIHQFLRQAVAAKCDVAVIEMTSEGAKQFRHKFINLDALIFLNLSPEHIESHGSYEKYREAKLSIAKQLVKSHKKNPLLIVNADDKEADKFLALPLKNKVTFSLSQLDSYSLKDQNTTLTLDGVLINSPLIGKFNLENVLAAVAYAQNQNIPLTTIKKALENLKPIRGRVEKVSVGDQQKFEVIVDYAHTTDSLEKLYQAFPDSKKICVLGATGGGRDKWKRESMGKIADEYCDEIILTDEDPYDEDPKQIVSDVAAGIKKHQPEIIMDRREAIGEAIGKAHRQAQNENGQTRYENRVTIFITGKGTDPYIMRANGKREPWDDAAVAREELKKII